ncbi:hypothetical protein GS938_14225 [Rhodococcus hoagii]|nr:hypothetical protein [Prescottella equi]
MSQWNIVVKPHKFLEDSSPWTILSSRFKYWHDMAAPTLDDAQLMVTTRRYLPGDPPPWQGANLRYGTIVVDIVDKSGYWDETSTGGNIWDGLKRTIVELADNWVDEIVNTVSEPIDPYKNIVGKWLGTFPRAPYVVYRDGEITACEAYEWGFTQADPCRWSVAATRPTASTRACPRPSRRPEISRADSCTSQPRARSPTSS